MNGATPKPTPDPTDGIIEKASRYANSTYGRYGGSTWAQQWDAAFEAYRDGYRHGVLSRDVQVAALRAENARLRSWDGLMEVLGEHYPESLMQNWPDDPGPRIVALIREVDKLREVVRGDERGSCPHGDETCPCPDGLLCHYEPPDPMRCPRTGLFGCRICGAALEALNS